MMRWIFFIIIFVVLSVYGYQGIKTSTSNKWVHYLFITFGTIVFINLILQLFIYSTQNLTPQKSYAIGWGMVFIAFNCTLILFLFSEDIFRFFKFIVLKINQNNTEIPFPSRRKFISQLALGLASIPFAGLIYGMYKGKYNFRVLKYTLEFEDLPKSFDGYQLTQISDIHSGSFDDKKMVQYAVDLINEQQSDVILFTGDIVNNKSDELLPWKNTLSKLYAKDGKYSILGNHDYGDYYKWENEEEKVKNLENLKTIQKEMGFKLLLNQNKFLERGEERLALVGVENWGTGGFKKAGDLQKASQDVDQNDFKILMSHDPSHWEKKVIDDKHHYHLTLSGHTHGMQFGVEIPGFIKWSPVKWRYKYWAGIYQEKNQYLNVNRGLGYIGYPGRIGMWPEITVIKLKKKV